MPDFWTSWGCNYIVTPSHLDGHRIVVRKIPEEGNYFWWITQKMFLLENLKYYFISLIYLYRLWSWARKYSWQTSPEHLFDINSPLKIHIWRNKKYDVTIEKNHTEHVEQLNLRKYLSTAHQIWDLKGTNILSTKYLPWHKH